jgi:hypothetical protein
LLERAALGVTTWTFPVLALVGTVVSIRELDTTLKTAGVPSKVTLVVPVRLFPRMFTKVLVLPQVGLVFTNGARPIENRKIVPSPSVPPDWVVP